MLKSFRFLAFDLGAESGRAIFGVLKEGRLLLEQVHRFPTEGIVMLGTRQWDVTRMYGEMLRALRKCVRDYSPRLDGIGVDSWGLDFALIARDGSLLGNPVHYRDKRTAGMLEAAFQIVPREDIYRATGTEFRQIHTLYQLLAMRLANSPLLEAADSLIMISDLFAYMLSGKCGCEYTNASNTQMLDPTTRTWNLDLLRRMGIPVRMLLPLTQPGTVLGPILPEIASATGIPPETPVIATAGHDTACAVAAVPAIDIDGGDWAFLSSGTWSLIGAEIDKPHISDEGRRANFTNEGGLEGTTRFLRNIPGLWLLQECRRVWQRGKEEIDYADLMAEAMEADPFAAVIDVEDPILLSPDNMPEAIRELCRRSGFLIPQQRGAVVRCVLESLAFRYRKTLRDLDAVLGRHTSRLHIIGGGSKNTLLNQMAADACNMPVLAGPTEATSLGNILVQAMAVRAIDSLDDARRLVANSVELQRYMPRNPVVWDRVENRLALLDKTLL